MPIREISQGSDDTQQKIVEEYADVFNGLGMFAGEYEVQIDDSVTLVQEPPRKIPFAKMDELKAALDQMEANGVIMKETEHTDWVSNLVITEKKDGNITVCLDPRSLNKAIKRNPFPSPTLEQIQAKLHGKTVFSILDQSSEYWQIKLSEESSKLCTFNTLGEECDSFACLLDCDVLVMPYSDITTRHSETLSAQAAQRTTC